MKIIQITIVSMLLSNTVVGQQTSVIDHYLVNPYFINPSAAGLKGNQAYLDYHKQWQGFQGSPETQIVTIDGNINRQKHGLGLSIINDQTNILGSTSGFLTYAYNIQLSKIQFLRFGASVGAVQNRIIYNNIIAEDPTELQLFENNQNATNFDIDAGLYYQFEKFSVGFAAKHLLTPSFRYENNFTANNLTFSRVPHYIINAQYDIEIKGGKWEFQPSVFMKGVQGVPFVFEGGITGTYKKIFWSTLRYSHNIGYTASIGGVISKQLVLGYSYNMSSSELAAHNSGSHEILIGYRFGSNNGGSGSNQEFKKLEEQNIELFENTDQLQIENEKIREELEDQRKKLKEAIYGLDELKKVLEKERADREKMISEFEFKPSNNPSLENEEPNEPEIIEPEQSYSSAEDQNPKEPEVNEDSSDKIVEGDLYVVVGATREMKEAQNFQKILTREYKLKTRIVRNSRASWFLIYTLETNDQKEANKELKRVKKVNTKDLYFGKPWIYFE